MNKKLLALGTLVSLISVTSLYADKDKKDCQMDQHHNRFEALDTNKDGKISKEEWSAHFDEMDANKDGSIDKEEMKKHHENMQEKMHEHMHHDMKDMKDK